MIEPKPIVRIHDGILTEKQRKDTLIYAIKRFVKTAEDSADRPDLNSFLWKQGNSGLVVLADMGIDRWNQVSDVS